MSSQFPDYDPSFLWIANPKKITQYPNREKKVKSCTPAQIQPPFVASKPVRTEEKRPPTDDLKPSYASYTKQSREKVRAPIPPTFSPSTQKVSPPPQSSSLTLSKSPYDLFAFASQLKSETKPAPNQQPKPLRHESSRDPERGPRKREPEESRGRPKPPSLSHLTDEERDLIHQARWFHKKGYNIPLYDTNADMEQVYFDVTRIHEQLELTSHVKYMKKQYMTYAAGIEMIDSQLPFDLNMGNLSQEVSWMLEKEKDNMERDYYINGAVKSDNPSWEIKMAFGLLLLQKVMGRNKSPSARPSPPRQQNSGKPSGMGSMMEGGVMGQVLPLLTSFFGNSTPAPQLRPLGAHVAPQTPGLRTPLMPINTSNLNSQRTALFPEFPDTGTPYVDLEALTKRTLAGMDTLDALTDVSDIPDL